MQGDKRRTLWGPNAVKAAALIVAGVVMPIVIYAAYSLTSYPILGLVGLLILLLVFTLWNGSVFLEQALRVYRAQRFSAAAMVLTVGGFATLACWTFLHPFILWYDRLALFLTFAFALALSIAALSKVRPLGLRNYVAPAYNAIGLTATLAWAIHDMGIALGPLSAISVGCASAQSINFPFSAAAAPFFFLPPLLTRLEPEGAPPLSKRGKISLGTMSWMAGKALALVCAYFTGLFVICTVLAVW